MNADVRRIGPEARTEGPPTTGMIREEAIATDRTWAGLVRTEAGMLSGWHHHGGYESTIYVLSGALRMESGPAGGEVVEAGPGDFVFVAAGAVHRESNPSDEESRIVVVRSGSGAPIVNVDGPTKGRPVHDGPLVEQADSARTHEESEDDQGDAREHRPA